MKLNYFLFLFLSFFIISCNGNKKENSISNQENKPKINGQELFENKGNCIACHQVDQKIIGPSIQEISKIYKDQKADIVLFLKGESEPIIDPSQYEIMKTNFAITKTMTDQELKAIEDYIYSN